MPPVVRSSASAETEVRLPVQAATSELLSAGTAVRVAAAEVRVTGGHGCAQDVPAAHHRRAAEVPPTREGSYAEVAQTFEGTNEVQRVVVDRAVTS